MRSLGPIAAIALATAPGLATADRGALTLELAPSLAWWPSMAPITGSGSGVSGTSGGGLVGLRYGLRHDLDLTASGFYEAPVDFANTGTTVGTEAGPLTGTLTARASRWGVLLGARWVHGLALRWFLGGEVGVSQQTFARVGLVYPADPGTGTMFELKFPDKTRTALVLSPLAGVEWQLPGRWSVAFAPRVQVMVGGGGRVGVVLPVSVGYSWYGF